MSLEQELNTIGRQARAASNALRSLSRRVKDAALIEIARRLRAEGAMPQPAAALPATVLDEVTKG